MKMKFSDLEHINRGEIGEAGNDTRDLISVTWGINGKYWAIL